MTSSRKKIISIVNILGIGLGCGFLLGRNYDGINQLYCQKIKPTIEISYKFQPKTTPKKEGLQWILEVSQKSLERGDYFYAELVLDDTKKYKDELNDEKEDLISKLRKQAQQMGLQQNLENSKDYIKKGEPLYAELSLEIVEIYADRLGVEIPSEAVELRSEVTVLRSKLKNLNN